MLYKIEDLAISDKVRRVALSTFKDNYKVSRAAPEMVS